MMGASPADMSLYTDMFHRHTEITRAVEETPGGVRTTTQSNAPDLVAKLHAHVSSMYSLADRDVGALADPRVLAQPSRDLLLDPAAKSDQPQQLR
jgi:hypothetical protein